MAPLTGPPPSPDIAAQQSPGQLSQYLSGYQPGGGQPQQPTGPGDLIRQKMSDVAMGLRDVAQVTATMAPALMPLIKRMVEAGSMFMNQLEQYQNQTGSASVPQGPPDLTGQGGQAEGAQPGIS